jgi:hypothetical protein
MRAVLRMTINFFLEELVDCRVWILRTGYEESTEYGKKWKYAVVIVEYANNPGVGVIKALAVRKFSRLVLWFCPWLRPHPYAHYKIGMTAVKSLGLKPYFERIR